MSESAAGLFRRRFNSPLFTSVTATALGKRSHLTCGLSCRFQSEGSGMDDMVVRYECVPSQTFSAETEIPAVASRLELLLSGLGNFAQKVPGFFQRTLRIFRLDRLFQQPLNDVAAHEFLM